MLHIIQVQNTVPTAGSICSLLLTIVLVVVEGCGLNLRKESLDYQLNNDTTIYSSHLTVLVDKELERLTEVKVFNILVSSKYTMSDMNSKWDILVQCQNWNPLV